MRRPQPHALVDVRLEHPADAPRRTLVLRSGRITEVLDASVVPPPDARVIDGKGMLALPAFVDAYTHAGCETPQPAVDRDLAPKADADVSVDMRAANRKGIAPAFRAADVFALEPEPTGRYRSLGFGALVSAPHGELLSGASALVSTRDAAVRDRLSVPLAFDHAGFEARGPGYPSTSMGALSQLRQFFLDARYVEELERRRADRRPGSRPPYDEDLTAIRPVLARQRKLVCEAETVNEIERWLALADEFDLEIALSGGREAWKLASVLAERRVPVFLTLDWGEEVEDPHEADGSIAKVTAEASPAEAEQEPERPQPEEKPIAGSAEREPAATTAGSKQGPKGPAGERWIYTEPLRTREEKRARWEESRDAAIHLSEAGVAIAFGSGGSTPRELVEHVRKLVEIGLPLDVALDGLTASAARLCGREKDMGRIDVGMEASIALWTMHPLLEKDAKVARLFVEGFPYEFDSDARESGAKPGIGVDASGTWILEFEAPDRMPARAELEMSADGEVEGTLFDADAEGGGEVEGRFDGRVEGKRIRLAGKLRFGELDAAIELEGELDGDEIEGTLTSKSAGGEDRRTFTATRQPQLEQASDDDHSCHEDER